MKNFGLADAEVNVDVDGVKLNEGFVRDMSTVAAVPILVEPLTQPACSSSKVATVSLDVPPVHCKTTGTATPRVYDAPDDGVSIVAVGELDPVMTRTSLRCCLDEDPVGV